MDGLLSKEKKKKKKKKGRKKRRAGRDKIQRTRSRISADKNRGADANDRANAPPFTKYLYPVRLSRCGPKKKVKKKKHRTARGELLIDIYLIVPDGYTEFREFPMHLRS